MVLTGGRTHRRCDRYRHRRDGRDNGQCAAQPQAFALTESRRTKLTRAFAAPIVPPPFARDRARARSKPDLRRQLLLYDASGTPTFPCSATTSCAFCADAGFVASSEACLAASLARPVNINPALPIPQRTPLRRWLATNAPLLVCSSSVGSEFPLPDGEADRVINAPCPEGVGCEPRISAILDEHASPYVRAQTYAHSCQTSGGPTSTPRLPHCRRWTGQQILAPPGGHARTRSGSRSRRRAARSDDSSFVIGEVSASSSPATIGRPAFKCGRRPRGDRVASCFVVPRVSERQLNARRLRVLLAPRRARPSKPVRSARWRCIARRATSARRQRRLVRRHGSFRLSFEETSRLALAVSLGQGRVAGDVGGRQRGARARPRRGSGARPCAIAVPVIGSAGLGLVDAVGWVIGRPQGLGPAAMHRGLRAMRLRLWCRRNRRAVRTSTRRTRRPSAAGHR